MTLLVFACALAGGIFAILLTVLFFVTICTKADFDPDELEGLIKSKRLKEAAAVKSAKGLLSYLNAVWRAWGKLVARRPLLVLLGAIVVAGACSAWIYMIKIETHPERLWVPPNSMTATAKKFFDETFGPFYRIEQLIITMKDMPEGANDSIIDLINLPEVLALQLNLTNMVVSFTEPGKNETTITLDDICFKPITGKGCMVQSLLGYWQSSLQTLECPGGFCNWLSPYANGTVTNEYVRQWVDYCANHQYDTNCLNEIGAPIIPEVVLGDFPGQVRSENLGSMLRLWTHDNIYY
jgi:Niemann-Pick C1 protein